MPDAHANFAFSTVKTAPSPATTGTSLGVQTGDGANFPAASFNAVVCPIGSSPLKANAEIVRVTAISTDTFTITRAQEGSTARSIQVGDQIFAGITKKMLTDAESSTGWMAPCRAYLKNTAAATAAINTVVPIDTADSGDDPGGHFSAAGTEIIVPQAGRFLVVATTCVVDGGVGAAALNAWSYGFLRVNGAGTDTYGYVSEGNATGASMISSIAALLKLSANDNVSLMVAASSSGWTISKGRELNTLSVVQLAAT